MPEAASSSSSPASELQLRAIALDLLYEHPLNANLMPEGRVEKLTHNIGRSGRYPPLIVRAHPELSGRFQILDGKHRVEALRRLELREALCYFWPCDDAEALVLLATLNRLEGEDVPARRADLLVELSALLPPEQLALNCCPRMRRRSMTRSRCSISTRSGCSRTSSSPRPGSERPAPGSSRSPCSLKTRR